MEKAKVKNFFVGLFVFILYFVATLNQELPLKLLHINYQAWNDYWLIFYSLIYELVLIGIIIAIYYKELKEQLQEYIRHANDYLKKYIKYWFIALGGMYVSNLIILSFFQNGIAGNEESVRQLLNYFPIYTFIASVVLAPFLEEIIFRYSFRKVCLQGKWIFIILSGLIFGGMHVVGNVQVWEDVLYLVPYSIPGIVFAYTLVKSDNIFVPITLHTIHNGILISMQIFLSLFL